MGTVSVPGVDTVTPTSADTVVGVQNGLIKRFGASPTFDQLSASSGAGMVGYAHPVTGSTLRTSSAKHQEHFSLLDMPNVDRNNLADNTDAWQAAAVYAAANGDTLVIPRGRWRFDGKLYLLDNLNVLWEDGAEIVRNVPTTGTHGFIEQSDLTTKVSNIKWRGGRITGASSLVAKGNTFCFYGDDILIDGVDIDGFGAQGRAFLIGGDRIRLLHPTVLNPFGGSGSGGIRVVGGDGFICYGAVVHSGDDCFQFVTGEDNTGPATFYDQNITNGTYSNCYGISDTARVAIASVNDAITAMSADLIGCSFVNVTGRSDGTGGTIFLGAQTAYGNGHSGVIRDLKVIGGYYECTSSSGTTPLASLVGTTASAGVVSGLELDAVTLRPAGANAEVLRTSGVQKGAKARNCTIYASTNGAATAPTVDVFQGDDTEIAGGTIYQGTATIALRTPNAVGRACTGLSVKGVEFRDCHDSVVYDNYATKSVYLANTFRKLSGGASATAITTTVNSVSCKARASVFDGIETAYSDSGTGSQLFGNDASGTFTATLTFATPGDVSVVYTSQTGFYSKTNNIVSYKIELDCTPTHSTASGVARIGGLPYTALNSGTYTGGGAVLSQTSTLSYGTGYTTLTPAAVHNQTYLNLVANGSGKNTSVMSTTNFPTATAQSLIVTGSYLSAT